MAGDDSSWRQSPPLITTIESRGRSRGGIGVFREDLKASKRACTILGSAPLGGGTTSAGRKLAEKSETSEQAVAGAYGAFGKESRPESQKVQGIGGGDTTKSWLDPLSIGTRT